MTLDYDPTALLDELSDWTTFIQNLVAEETITSNIENKSYKDGGTPFMTDLDLIDTNNDGFAVIDIDVGDTDFLVNNSDWILKTNEDTIAIFRIVGDHNSNFTFTNSTIMMGPGCLDDQGAPTQALTCDSERSQSWAPSSFPITARAIRYST